MVCDDFVMEKVTVHPFISFDLLASRQYFLTILANASFDLLAFFDVKVKP